MKLLEIKTANGYELGRRVGVRHRKNIQEDSGSEAFAFLQAFYNSDFGREVYDKCLERSEECYPTIVDEIRGIADGADVPFENIFLHSMSSEIWLNYGEDIKTETGKTVFPDTRGCVFFCILLLSGRTTCSHS